MKQFQTIIVLILLTLPVMATAQTGYGETTTSIYSVGSAFDTGNYSSKSSHLYGSSTSIGNTTFHNFNDNNGNTLNGTSQDIGNTTFLNYNDTYGNSSTGTINSIGNNSYINVYSNDGGSTTETITPISNTINFDFQTDN